MKKNKNIILILLVGLLIFIPLIIKADSGWDTDYDSGSSYDYDYDSGSSYDYDYGSSSDDDSDRSYSGSSGSNSNDENVKYYIAFIGLIFMLGCICISIRNIKRRKLYENHNHINYNHFERNDIKDESINEFDPNNIPTLSDDIIKSFDPNMSNEEIKKIVFDIFKEFQNAMMNFEYNKLHELVSDELYNTYKSQLDTLNNKGEKNIIENISCIDCNAVNINLKSNIETIDVKLNVNMNSYVVDSKNNVIDGYNSIIYNNIYLITIIKDLGNNFDNSNRNLSNKFIINKIVNISSRDNNLNDDTIGKEVFYIYENVQKAWMNFDYDRLEELLTDELYNTYKMQLESLSVKGQKNIMENIHFVDCKIINSYLNDNKESVDVRLTVRMKDYVIDSKGKVVRGNSSTTYEITYEITIVRNICNIIKQCPNCGASLDNDNHQKCKYCGSIIINSSSEFVMSKKKNINQKIY